MSNYSKASDHRSLQEQQYLGLDMVSGRKSDFVACFRPMQALMASRRASAAAVVGSVLEIWRRSAFPQLPPNSLAWREQLCTSKVLQAFAGFLEGEGLVAGAYWLSTAYSLLSNSGYRKRLAMFFTPPSLTGRLLDDLQNSGVDFASACFCDPACGGAAFLAPIAQRMSAALEGGGKSANSILCHVENNLFGIDLDANLCELSKQFLLMVLYPHIKKAKRLPELRVNMGNSLSDLTDLHGAFDAVVCNPPYRKMASNEVLKYRKEFDRVIEGQPNLYTLFIDLCLRLTKNNGASGLVTPTSFMSGKYFSKLRTVMMSESEILRIGMISDREGVFMDVEQETALTILRKSPKLRHGTSAKVAVVAPDGLYKAVGTCALPNSGSSWPIPRETADAKIIAKAKKLGYSLADYGYSVRIGSIVWNRDQKKRYVSQAMVSAHMKGGVAIPLIWSSDVRPNGKLEFEDTKKTNGEARFLALNSSTHQAIIRRPAVVLQRVTSNDQPRRLVAASVPRRLMADYGGFAGENHTVIVEQVTRDARITPKQLATLLNSNVVDRYFRCISGATNVSVFELNQLALPEPGELKARLKAGESMESAARATWKLDD